MSVDTFSFISHRRFWSNTADLPAVKTHGHIEPPIWNNAKMIKQTLAKLSFLPSGPFVSKKQKPLYNAFHHALTHRDRCRKDIFWTQQSDFIVLRFIAYGQIDV